MKKTATKIIAIILSLFMFTACSPSLSEIEVPTLPTQAPPIVTQEPSEQPMQESQEAQESLTFKIMFTNDTHGRITDDSEQPSYGYARVSQMKKDLAAEGEVLLFSAGDVLQGTPYVNESLGATAIDLMNLAGYDALTPGNHDFDWGGDNLSALRQVAEFEFLSANILYREDESHAFTDNKIFTLGNGATVGVFGLTTPTTMTTTTPTAVKDYTFLADDELYEIAQKQVDFLKEQECDIIVCLSHLGIDDSAMGSRSYDVIDNVAGIDLFIDAHSHVEMNEIYGDSLLVSTGSFGENVGVATYIDGEITAELVPAVIEDLATAQLSDSITTEVDDLLSIPVATTEFYLNGDYEYVRNSETNLADLSTDAILWYANTHMSVTADVGIINSGSIRASIDEGDITLLDVKEVFPYANTLVTLELTGAQLLEALEAASAELPDPTAPMAQVSGIEYTVNTGTRYQEGDTYPDSTFAAPAKPGSRVEITSVGGDDFSLGEIYTIVTIDFLAAGGDSYYAFTQGKEGTTVDSGVLLEDALIAYIDEALNGEVGDEYELPKERITID